MQRFDPVALIEATSGWDPDEQRWLSGIAHATRALDLGAGRVVYTLHFDSASRPPRLVAAEDGAPGWPDELARLNQAFTPRATALVHVPLGRVRTHGPAVVRENARRSGLTEAQSLEVACPGAAGPPLAEFAFGGSGKDRVAFVALTATPRALSPERRRLVEMFIAHFAATVRLRRELDGGDPLAGADAVISPSGRVLHASPAAGQDRQSLTDAVLSRERARGSLRSRSPEEAVATWRALVAGRYTLIESVERDGKRLVFARKNEAHLRGLSALTRLEAACAYYTALGQPQKHIAYELGLSVSAAARATRTAIQKLRLRSPEELVRVVGPLIRDPANAARGKRAGAARLARLGRTPPSRLAVEQLGPRKDGWALLSWDEAGVGTGDLPRAQAEVFAAVAAGKTNEQIAKLRGTSVRTVDNQVGALLRRFGASSRVDLVRRLMAR